MSMAQNGTYVPKRNTLSARHDPAPLSRPKTQKQLFFQFPVFNNSGLQSAGFQLKPLEPRQNLFVFGGLLGFYLAILDGFLRVHQEAHTIIWLYQAKPVLFGQPVDFTWFP